MTRLIKKLAPPAPVSNPADGAKAHVKKSAAGRTVLIVLACLFIYCALWCAGVEREGEELAAKVVRLHIVADSDDGDAQRLKLLVRDGVLSALSPFLEGCASAEEAAAAIGRNIRAIQDAAEKALRENGCPLPVSASLKNEFFAQRRYEGFTLPAGEYAALRLTIGRGGGRNWWCVVFPPRCLGSAIEDDEAVLAVLSQDEVELITNGGYVVKFKILELFTRLRESLRKIGAL